MGNCCNPTPRSLGNGHVQASAPVKTSDVTLLPMDTRPQIRAQAVIKRVRAMYDYKGRTPDDLSFVKGEILDVLDMDSDNADWWRAKRINSNSIGFIPSNYVTDDDENKIESQEWYFGIERRDAERKLLWVGNEVGTFLIRKSADNKAYALTVKDLNKETNEHCIKHYKIRKMDEGGVFIAARRPFKSMMDLVRHYMASADGLCCRLEKPCPKVPATVPFKQLEVRRSQVKRIRRLGHGNFGEVSAGKFQNSVDVAIKSLKPGTMPPGAFLAEAKRMHKFRHPKLVQLMGVCTDCEPMLIITELMVNGSLLDYLREKKSLERFPFADLIDICAQVAEGMKYLEKENFIHRDLRAANILVGENNEVKVADFGLAKEIKVDDTNDGADEPMKFPIKWTAPEAAFKREFSTKSDVWSFGVLLYEIMTFGRVPYPSLSGQEVLNKVSGSYRMEKPSSSSGLFHCPDSVYGLMLNCWDRDPERRPTFEHIYHFFDEFEIANEPSYKDVFS
ncbi:DgyrCDS13472 [Dimorphilus gyrociliatus]|uniref:Tyrosine-protein kinase n=1 Tax=Dimorphilus gyrociliatus TaxID=2664684 RepID=A0A7I8WAR5_9ANNE|nr:DgyrCDS13472 [Dimorphilus gyrociliatus]